MIVLIRVVVGLLLAAHGLVHLLYLAPEARNPSYPFTLEDSWLVPGAARRPLALALLAATIAAFGLLALAVWGVPGLAHQWPALAIAGASSSLALLIAFWDARLLFGVALDAALIAAAVIRPEWVEKITG